MPAFQGQCGPTATQDGQVNTARITRDTSLAVQQSHGPLYECVYRGNLFSLPTAAAGVTITATQTVAVTLASPIVGIFNPANSGVNAVVLYVDHNWASGTAGAGGLAFATSICTVTAASGAGAVNLKTQAVGSSQCKTFTAAAATGQTAAPNIVRMLGGPSTGALAANSTQYYQVFFEGGLIVPPGCLGMVLANAAGTSPVVLASLIWEETPV